MGTINCTDVPWGSQRLISPTTRLFVQQMFGLKQKYIKALHYWPFIIQSPYIQRPGPCITNVFATRRKNFSQWHRSFQRKLLSHWLKFLRHVAITLVIQGPVMRKVFPCHDITMIQTKNWSTEAWRLKPKHSMQPHPRLIECAIWQFLAHTIPSSFGPFPLDPHQTHR